VLVVGVVTNPAKRPMFTVEERIDMLKVCLRGVPNARIEGFEGLLVNFVSQCEARIIIKGLRALSDFEYEFQMALMNRKLAPGVETIFLMTSDRYAFLSSSLVKEIASMGGKVGGLVPQVVEEHLVGRFTAPQGS